MKMMVCMLAWCVVFAPMVWAAEGSSVVPPDVLAATQEANASARNVPFPDWIRSRFAPYEAAGRPDPFMSFIQIRAVEQARSLAAPEKKREPSSPLETVDLRTLKLVGVMQVKGGATIGVVQMPDGKSFIVRPGMGIGLYGGVIKGFEKGTMVVEEKTYDILGEEQLQIVTLSLRPQSE
jgi:type IV pilus assembly protein PilP